MPIGFLTAAERDRLNHFPTQIPDEDLRAFFLLTEDDQRVINQQREAHTRLGFALQLCAVRYLGFAPDDLHTTPSAVVTYIARQLEVSPEAIHAYGRRRKTRTTHLVQIQRYLGFRLATPLDL
jgi:TnpA family transposase